MALAERAELVARLSLDDQFSGKVKGIQSKMSGLGGAAKRAGKAIGVGIGAGVAVGAAITTRAVRSGLDSLAELESATTSVDGAIKTMGLTGQVTSGQIADWANEIERNVGAAFDDKEIVGAASNLIRYGRVTVSNLKPALEVMTDLAVKTGSVDSASSLLGKALADPTKAAGKLARVGVILTDQQKKQIDKMAKAGDAAGAQAVLLDALSEATKGAAEASQGPYQRSIALLQDAWEDATKALAVGFLPLLEEVRDLITDELAKPATLQRIKDFGKGLAGGLQGLIDAAKKVPWDQVGDAMKLAGQGAKAAYDLFTGLPPWVQTAVLTGWGLNKLTGGALGGIVGELGKGLIKGVLGMNAAVVNINAGTVNGAGGGAGGGGGLGLAGTVAATAGVAGAGALATHDVPLLAEAFGKGYQAYQQGDTRGLAEAMRDVATGTWAIPQPLRDIAGNLLTLPPKVTKPFDAAAFRLGEKEDLSRQAITNSLARVRENAERNRIALQGTIRNNRPVINVRVPIAVYTNNGVTRRVYSTGSSINNPSGPQEY